jgi:hypothetical protein
MNRFALIATIGLLALTLTGCGEQGNKPVGTNNGVNTMTQPDMNQNPTQNPTQNPIQNPNQPTGGENQDQTH